MVASSFTLLDLPSELSRLSHIETLWNRVEENGFLVLSEVGTTAGFQSINEARVLLKNLFQENQGHIFSPVSTVIPRLVRPSTIKLRIFPLFVLTEMFISQNLVLFLAYLKNVTFHFRQNVYI